MYNLTKSCISFLDILLTQPKFIVNIFQLVENALLSFKDSTRFANDSKNRFLYITRALLNISSYAVLCYTFLIYKNG